MTNSELHDQVTALESEMEAIEDSLDALSITAAISIICDTFDEDPILVIQHISHAALHAPLSSFEKMIRELIEVSQSNYENSLPMIHRSLEIDDELGILQF